MKIWVSPWHTAIILSFLETIWPLLSVIASSRIIAINCHASQLNKIIDRQSHPLKPMLVDMFKVQTIGMLACWHVQTNGILAQRHIHKYSLGNFETAPAIIAIAPYYMQQHVNARAGWWRYMPRQVKAWTKLGGTNHHKRKQFFQYNSIVSSKWTSW